MLVRGVLTGDQCSRGAESRRPQGIQRVAAAALAWLALAALAYAAVACSDDGGISDGAPDASDAATSDATAPDASADATSDRAAPDASVPGGDVSLFVAQGHGGRTLLSCDRGRSWVADRSDDDSIRCFRDGFDCDHHPGAAKGITYGRGYFFATFGWGTEGSLRRSRDGVSWETSLSGTEFGGIAFGSGRVVAGHAFASRWSDDLGDSWTMSDPGVGFSAHVRRMAFAGDIGSDGAFVLVGNRDAGDHLTLSEDGGETWHQAAERPAACGGSIAGAGGIASGGGSAVILYRSGTVCRSRDGASWDVGSMPSTPVEGDAYSYLLFADSRFWVWEGGSAYTSEDGASWTAAPIDPPTLRLGPVAYGGGTFVGVRTGWGRDYDMQEVYYSDDGLRWQAASLTGGHPIAFITHGRGAASDVCP